MNKADIYFKNNIRKILEFGTWDEDPRPRYKSDGEPAFSKYITMVYEEYDLDKGELPLTSLRPIAIKGGISELLAIYQTQTNTQEGFKHHDVNWWIDWMNEDGNIGRAYSYNLESHRPNEMKREIVSVERKTIDNMFGDLKETSYNRTHSEVGYLGDLDSVRNISKKHMEILRKRWMSMLDRCYGNGLSHIKSYRERLVFVHQDWHSFEQFLKDVRYLPQYHLAKEDDFEGWDLDKDYYDANAYSRETCVWLSRSDNLVYRKLMKPFYIIDKDERKTMFLSPIEASNHLKCTRQTVEQSLKVGCKVRGHKTEYLSDGNLYRYELSRNQVNELISGIKKEPYSRRHMLSFFNWSNHDKKMLVECAFQSLYTVRKMAGDYYLDATLIQRSSDYPTAGHINMIQYVALQMMIAHEVGMKVGKFGRFTQNLHCYNRHVEQANELLMRPTAEVTPKLVLNAEGKGFYDITVGDFQLLDYTPTKPQMKFDLGI